MHTDALTKKVHELDAKINEIHAWFANLQMRVEVCEQAQKGAIFYKPENTIGVVPTQPPTESGFRFPFNPDGNLQEGEYEWCSLPKSNVGNWISIEKVAELESERDALKQENQRLSDKLAAIRTLL